MPQDLDVSPPSHPPPPHLVPPSPGESAFRALYISIIDEHHMNPEPMNSSYKGLRRKSLRAGRLIPIAISIVISFPPLFGDEIPAILGGLVWGHGIAIAIVTAGVLLGEIANSLCDGGVCDVGHELSDAHPGAALSLPQILVQIFVGVLLACPSDTKDSKLIRILNITVVLALVIITYVAMRYVKMRRKEVILGAMHARRKARQFKMRVFVGGVEWGFKDLLRDTMGQLSLMDLEICWYVGSVYDFDDA
ncbi:hypothetical protein JAAARDRAFT_192115 [Jaapia argillacea MUCL 33604]|uniref:Uncharacterized protein n=1 Tax=Jaapia argillacea MUCL 33604 TaxID=933084 RepID=A0A067PY34_9AGAM|nr:hypothetical protein JAAARDRAFT_192115 [Jaapia argillacea MUCL 33604]